MVKLFNSYIPHVKLVFLDGGILVVEILFLLLGANELLWRTIRFKLTMVVIGARRI